MKISKGICIGTILLLCLGWGVTPATASLPEAPDMIILEEINENYQEQTYGEEGNIAAETADAGMIDSGHEAEEPDVSKVNENTEYYFRMVYGGDEYFRIPDSVYEAHISKNGVMALQFEYEGAVYIYKNGRKTMIPSPVSYYMISENGRKVVYGPNYEEAWIWDTDQETAEQISDSSQARDISADGSAVYLEDGIWTGSDELQELPMFAYAMAMSPDAGILYYYRHYRSTSSRFDSYNQEELEETPNYYMQIGIMENGKSKEFLSYVDPDYYPQLVAVSEDYREAVFRFRNDYYYYSADDENVPVQRIGGIGDKTMIALAALYGDASLQNAGYRSTVTGWTNGSYSGYYGGPVVQSKIRNAVYCLMSPGDGYYFVTLAVLGDDLKMNAIASNIISDICVSDDGNYLWFIADEYLTFYDLTAERAGAEQTVYAGYSSAGLRLAISSDGKQAACVGNDGSLYLCDAENPDRNGYVSGNIVGVWYGPDHRFYAVKDSTYFGSYDGYYSPYYENCILYAIDTENLELLYQKENVMDFCVTKKDVYVLTSDYSDVHYLYCRDGGGYSLVSTTEDSEIEGLFFSETR